MISPADRIDHYTPSPCRASSSPASQTIFLVRLPMRILVKTRFVIFLLFAASFAALADSRPSEYDVKAAYLLNFGKFVRVESAPATSARASFDVCVVGSDPIEAALKTLTNGERVGGLPVRILHLKDGLETRSCQIAYISGSEGSRLDQDLEQLRGSDVLTVSDDATFLARGGMIQFLLVSNHVRFSVSLDAVRQSHLVLSSEFLRVAYAISGMPAKGATP